jgi:hypothetical protein
LYGKSSEAAGFSHLFASCPGPFKSQKSHLSFDKVHMYLRFEENFCGGQRRNGYRLVSLLIFNLMIIILNFENT